MDRRKFVTGLTKALGIATVLPFVASIIKEDKQPPIYTIQQSGPITITLPSNTEGVKYEFVNVISDGENWTIQSNEQFIQVRADGYGPI